MIALADTAHTMSASADIAVSGVFDAPIVATPPNRGAVIPALSFAP